MRTLLIEDDAAIASLVETGLTEEEIGVTCESTFDAGHTRAMLGTFDVIILDIMLPGGSGFDLCRQLRKRGNTTPVLMLTARDAVDDRVLGLNSGADDYLTKPFALRELLARVHALARRSPSIIPDTMHIADLEVDLRGHRARRGGRDLDLTAKEFALLECLARHRDKYIDRATITSHVWDDNHDPFTNVLEVLVRRLRRKVDADYEQKLIHTLRGAGYRLGL